MLFSIPFLPISENAFSQLSLFLPFLLLSLIETLNFLSFTVPTSYSLKG